MDEYEKNYLSQRPQELCLMCGRCCKVSTSTIPHDMMLKLKQEGHQGAIDFLDIFEPYDSVEAARKVCPEVVDNIMKLSKDDGKSVENMTFYRCKYIQDDNLCGIYDKRKTLCIHFPSSPWAVVPPGCGFEAWLFLKREEAKQKVRKLKEELIELALLKTKVKDVQVLLKINAVEKKINGIIDSYKQYGSENW